MYNDIELHFCAQHTAEGNWKVGHEKADSKEKQTLAGTMTGGRAIAAVAG